MEPHCLPIFFSLNLMLMAAHAAIPPELYWKMMLPSTPLPKAITELLRGDMSTWKSVNVDNELKDELSVPNLGAKEIPSQENALIYFPYRAKKTESKDELSISDLGTKEIPSQENPLIYAAYIAKETPSKDELLISDLGAKEIPSQENALIYFPYRAKKTESKDELSISDLGTKEIPSQENPLIYAAYIAKETPSKDELLISDLGAKEIPSQENALIYFPYRAKKTESKDELSISNIETKEIPSQENPLISTAYTANKVLSKDKLPISDFGAEETPQASNDANVVANHGASHHHLHHHECSSRACFFQEDQIHPGNKFYVHLNKVKSVVPLLPRQIAEQIPFSLDKMEEAKEMLSVKLTSKNAEIVEKTIGECGAPAMDGEVKYCATSLESMMDFVTSKLGKNVRAMSTELTKETKPQNLIVKNGVKKLANADADDHTINCHPMSYPYVVFFCHELQKTSAYFVPLEGQDGVRAKAFVICHKDTSKWDPNHVAFQVLKVKPGTVPVCHFLPEGHLLWLSK